MIVERGVIQPLEHSPIRELVDPDNTLPYVEFRSMFELGNDGIDLGLFFYDIYNASETCVGIQQLGVDIEDESQYFENVWLKAEEDIRGKGYGMATYILATENAHRDRFDFTTGESTTVYAKRIWEKLAGTGVANIKMPFLFQGLEDIGEEERVATYKGKCRVPLL
jgi:hypothetical protein